MTRANCQHCRELMDDWLNSELSVETTQDILKHIEGCEDCRGELERRQVLRRLLQQRLTPPSSPALRGRVILSLGSEPVSRPELEVSDRPAHQSRVFVNIGQAHWFSPAYRLPLSSTRWLRHSTVGIALVSVAVVVALWSLREESVSAAELLTKASTAERSLLDRKTIALHRSFNLEERDLPSRTLVSRRRVEVWRDGRTGLTARRAFDEHDRLVAAEWVREDGSSTIYRPGTSSINLPATSFAKSDARQASLISAGELWRADLSAAQFQLITRNTGGSAVRESAVEYEVKLQNESPTDDGVSAGTLVLRRPDLRPVRETLVIARNGKVREYGFIERTFTPTPLDNVAAAVFEPDAELTLLPSAPLLSAEGFRLPSTPKGRPTRISSLDNELEVDTLYALHRIGADVRERLAVTSDDGILRVRGTVASDERRDELFAALKAPTGDSSVHMDVNVDPGAAAEPFEMDSTLAFPAADAVRRYFADYMARKLSAEQRATTEVASLVDDATLRMAQRVSERSARARQHAEALSALFDRFGTVTPPGLSLNATATWQTMIRDHARAVTHETEALRLELQPVFFATAPPTDGGSISGSGSSSDLAVAVKALLRLTQNHDETIRAAFRADPSLDALGRVDSDSFWRSLLEAERLGSEFERPWNLGR